jgi:hypothetical protein
MQLKIKRGVSYLSEPKAKSRVGGYFFLGNNSNNKASSLTNGPLLCIFTSLKHVVSSVVESESDATFIMANKGVVMRNCTADGIINDTVQQKTVKSNGHAFLFDQ